jgi:geranylgeranyl diphosphate synthase, type I
MVAEQNVESKIIKQRCEKILERFGQVAIENVTNAKMIEAIEELKKYWKDFSRPALTSFSCEAVGENFQKADDAALMLTLASSGFGIHDDILDKSESKHLRMTIPGIFGVDTALLLGDLLIVKAWAVMHGMDAEKQLALIIFDEYEKTCIEVCEAELLETQCRKNFDTDLEFYQSILWKAMGETAICCKIGAILGGGSPDEIKALSAFGRRVGFVSRLADDIEDCLNVKGDLPHRIMFESVPLPLLYAAKSSTERHVKVSNIFAKKNLNPEDFRAILEICFESEAFEFVRKIAEQNIQLAKAELRILENRIAKNILIYIADKSYQRIIDLCV